MKNKYINLIKDTGIFALGSFGSKFILFFMLPLYTNYLSTEEYGLVELIHSLEQLIMPAITLMISDAVLRFGMSKDEKREDVVKNAVAVWMCSGVVVIGVTPLFGLYKIIDEWKWYLCIFVIVNGLQTIGVNYLKVKNKNKIYAVVSIIQTFVMATLNIMFLVILDWGIAGYLLANIIAYGMIAIVSMYLSDFFVDIKKSNFDKHLLKKMLLFSIPLVFNTTSWWLISFSDKFMIEFMIGISALGIYTVATKIPSLVNVIVSIFSQAWKLSAIRETEGAEESTFYSNVFTLFCMTVFGSGILINSIIRPFMAVYVGKEFSEAWKYVPLLIVGAVFSAISTFNGSIYSAIKKTVESMITAVIAAVINIIVNLVLIPVVGVWGAIVGTILAYIILANIRLVSVIRIVKIKISWRMYIGNILLLLLQALFISFDINIYMVSLVAIVLFVLNNTKEFSIVLALVRQGR